MVAGKRYAEMMLAERTGAKIRKSLESYSACYLRFVWALSATVLIMTYCLWAFEIRETHHNSVWSVISIVPFVVAVLRYSVDVDGGNGGEPEEIALGDRVLQVLARPGSPRCSWRSTCEPHGGSTGSCQVTAQLSGAP